MPTYQYACTECEHRFEVVQSFTDAALASCPECSGRLRKLYGAVGIVFKGSGFYRTDSRSNGSGPNGSASNGAGESKSTGESAKSKSNGESSGSKTAGESGGSSKSSESKASSSTSSTTKPTTTTS